MESAQSLDQRELNDAETVRLKFPDNTRHVTSNGISGYLYSITTSWRDDFSLFVFFADPLYKVYLVSPTVPERDRYACHVGAGGELDLSVNGGCESIEKALARSHLWAESYSVWKRTGGFA